MIKVSALQLRIRFLAYSSICNLIHLNFVLNLISAPNTLRIFKLHNLSYQWQWVSPILSMSYPFPYSKTEIIEDLLESTPVFEKPQFLTSLKEAISTWLTCMKIDNLLSTVLSWYFSQLSVRRKLEFTFI